MYRLTFSNSNEQPIYVQIDPWACVYKLEKGETITIVEDSTTELPRMSFDECGDTRIVTLWDCDGFYVVVDDKRLHWQDYPTNL